MALALGDNNNNGQINHGDIAAMNGAAALTICCWRLADEVASPGVLEKGVGAAAFTEFFGMGNREMHVREWPAWERQTSTYQIAPGAWGHHACVFDGSLSAANRVKLFGEGVEQATTGGTAGTTLLDTTGNGVIICRGNVAGVWAHLRIWLAALTEAELYLEMNRYWAARRADLILDAPYDDNLDPRDYSSNGNDGTWDRLSGTPERRSGPPISYGGKVLVTG